MKWRRKQSRSSKRRKRRDDLQVENEGTDREGEGRLTEAEICRSYKNAKNQVTQIGILADLSGLSKIRVIVILKKHGIRIPEVWEKRLEKYLDVIDGKIRELETEYKEIARAIMTAPADGAPDKEVNAGRHSRNEKY